MGRDRPLGREGQEERLLSSRLYIVDGASTFAILRRTVGGGNIGVSIQGEGKKKRTAKHIAKY